MDLTKPVDAKIKIKPIYIQLIHSSAYEGPCRVGKKENLTQEADRQANQNRFEQFVEQAKKNVGPDAELLEPAVFEWKDDFVIPTSEVEQFEADVQEADLMFLGLGGLSQYPAIKLAERYCKPVAMIGHVGTVDITAYLRARGLEAYAFIDYEDFNHFLSLLRARKALRQTRLLIALKGNLIPTGVVSSIYDLEYLREHYSVQHTLITAEELLETMRNLSSEQLEEAEQITDRLIANAEECYMTHEDVLPSVKFYLATKQTLAKYECSAFAIPCFEICATRVTEQEHVVFCLTHTLLKDEGIPSACEGDVNVLMAISVLMYLSKKSPYMGNTGVIDREKNIIGVHHDVPGLKMKGFDQPDLPYAIKNFTRAGWGATIRYDISRDIGEPVTIARFNPQGTKLLVTSGEVTGCRGYVDVSCSLGYQMKVRDAVGFFRHEQDFGHHFALVFGDYVEDLKELGLLAGFDVVEA